MCVGVICSCMPSLALLAHHPTAKSYWSKLKPTNSSKRDSSRGTRSTAKAMKHDYASGKRNYANIGENGSIDSVNPLNLDLELGRVGKFNTFETHVGTGGQGKFPTDGLYRTREVEQWSVDRDRETSRDALG